MTLRTVCKHCGRSYAEVLYYVWEEGYTIDEVLHNSDYLIHGRLCCVLELKTNKPNVNLFEYRLVTKTKESN